MSGSGSEGEVEKFEGTDAGASLTYPLSAGSIKKGSFMVFDNDKPCKVVDYKTAKTGKHGAAKAMITGIDIFTGRKYETTASTGHNVLVPNISRANYTVITVDETGYLTLMDAQGATKQDLKLPDETEEDQKLSDRIKAALDEGKEISVTVMSAMNTEKVVEMSENVQ